MMKFNTGHSFFQLRAMVAALKSSTLLVRMESSGLILVVTHVDYMVTSRSIVRLLKTGREFVSIILRSGIILITLLVIEIIVPSLVLVLVLDLVLVLAVPLERR